MTARIRHSKSRPLPPAIEPEMPAHLRMLTLTALAGTINAPIGSSMPQIYLASARALIESAVAMDRAQRADFMKGAGK